MIKFTAVYTSGVVHTLRATTLLGAKREAYRGLTYGVSVMLVDESTGRKYRREFRSRLNRFGWSEWKYVGGTGERYLMNPCTGSIDTEENWKADMSNWDTTQKSAEEQFKSLIEVDEQGREL